jgi:hypothetical protein
MPDSRRADVDPAALGWVAGRQPEQFLARHKTVLQMDALLASIRSTLASRSRWGKRGFEGKASRVELALRWAAGAGAPT